MTYKTIEGVLTPDGRVTLPSGEIPDHPVRVMVTILGSDETTPEGDALAELGDYHERLTDYEERLARGEIRWQ